jgi:hypothetical protein
MQRQALDPDAAAISEPREDLLALHEALDRLEAEDPLKAKLVKLGYFVGRSLAEAAAALDLSERPAGTGPMPVPGFGGLSASAIPVRGAPAQNRIPVPPVRKAKNTVRRPLKAVVR